MDKKLVDEYGHVVDDKGNVIDEDGRVWMRDDSWFRIGLFELICGLETNKNAKTPSFCKYGAGKPGDYCLENLCPHISISTVPLTIAYTDKYGYVKFSEGFSEGIYIDKDMDEKTKKLLNIWEKVCEKKIDEVDTEYKKELSSEVNYTKFNENYKLEKWYPAKYANLCSMYDVRAIEDCIEGLFIELVPDSIVETENKKHKTIYIHWPGNYVSYMESKSRARNLINLDENDNRWTFFKVKESAYVDFIKKDSCRVKGDNLEHFCIIGTNSVVDILSPYEPKILDENKKPIAGAEKWDE